MCTSQYKTELSQSLSGDLQCTTERWSSNPNTVGDKLNINTSDIYKDHIEHKQRLRDEFVTDSAYYCHHLLSYMIKVFKEFAWGSQWYGITPLSAQSSWAFLHLMCSVSAPYFPCSHLPPLLEGRRISQRPAWIHYIFTAYTLYIWGLARTLAVSVMALKCRSLRSPYM